MYLTLPEHLHRQAAAQSERTAMIYVTGNTVQKISYRQFYDQVQRLAGWLRRQGLQKGDRGLIIMENRPEWPVSYFGLLLAGGTAVPVDLQSRPEHIDYVLEQTQAKVVFASAKAPLAEIARAPSVQHLVVVGDLTTAQPQAVAFQELLASPPAAALPDIHRG